MKRFINSLPLLVYLKMNLRKILLNLSAIAALSLIGTGIYKHFNTPNSESHGNPEHLKTELVFKDINGDNLEDVLVKKGEETRVDISLNTENPKIPFYVRENNLVSNLASKGVEYPVLMTNRTISKEGIEYFFVKGQPYYESYMEEANSQNSFLKNSFPLTKVSRPKRIYFFDNENEIFKEGSARTNHYPLKFSHKWKKEFGIEDLNKDSILDQIKKTRRNAFVYFGKEDGTYLKSKWVSGEGDVEYFLTEEGDAYFYCQDKGYIKSNKGNDSEEIFSKK